MPQERDNPYPFPTAEEVEAAPGTREEKSARFVITRHIKGVPQRGYLLGDCDHAPIYRGVRDLTTAIWALIDKLDPEDDAPNPRFTQEELGLIEEVRVILTDHGCATAAEMASEKEARQAAQQG